MRARHGFTLVELMIVVAIIGILAALAIPNYLSAQLKAKRAEIAPNVEGIRTAQLAYNSSYDMYLDCDAAPRSRAEMDKTAVPWVTDETSNWRELGWEPDGLVRGSYETNHDTYLGFTVIGASDVDDDSNEAQWTASAETGAVVLTAPDAY
jgi:type IV pilus assembly protein PilA